MVVDDSDGFTKMACPYFDSIVGFVCCLALNEYDDLTDVVIVDDRYDIGKYLNILSVLRLNLLLHVPCRVIDVKER